MESKGKLIISARSPFARRIRIALKRIGWEYSEEVMDVFRPTAELFKHNPLGLVPVFVDVSGRSWIDSSALLEYLHDQTEEIWPKGIHDKLLARQESMLSVGVMTAVVQRYLEKFKPHPDQETVEEYEQAILRTLGVLGECLERSGLSSKQARFDLGVALEYLSLRYPEMNWIQVNPGFSSVLQSCRREDCFVVTVPPPV